ncbi:MAG TPA: hypothetical protein PLL77_15020 [Pyrinomonadaceae bacterium]|nr:hypothetical protein [Pyrinomonadaceae bacterium]
MTKNIKYLVSLVFMTLVFAVAATAQLPSLANVGDDVYTSEADGFEIAVPDGCMKSGLDEGVRSYSCDVKEGRITVLVNPDNTNIKTNADLANFLRGFKEGLVKNPDVKFFGETTAQIGDYRGASYQITMEGEKTLMVALVWGKFAVLISGRANSKVANSAELISSAVRSFTFVSPSSK